MLTMIGAIGGVVTTWLTGRQKKAEAKIEMQLAEMQNKTRLLADKESNNHEWEMANLTDKDKWLRRVSFSMFASPFIIAIFAPEHVQIYFETAIATVPKWWLELFTVINGGIWGISSLKNALPSIISVFKSK